MVKSVVKAAVAKSVNPEPIARRGPGRPPNDLRSRLRQHILDRAWEEFVEHGYGEATVQRICARAQIGTATFYKYYPDKSSIFAETMLRVHASWTAVQVCVEDSDSLEESLHKYAVAFVKILPQNQFNEASRLLYAEAKRFPALTSAFREASQDGLMILGRIISHHLPQLNRNEVADLAIVFIDMIAGRLLREQMLGLPPLAPKRLTTLLKVSTKIFARGLLSLPQ